MTLVVLFKCKRCLLHTEGSKDFNEHLGSAHLNLEIDSIILDLEKKKAKCEDFNKPNHLYNTSQFVKK